MAKKTPTAEQLFFELGRIEAFIRSADAVRRALKKDLLVPDQYIGRLYQLGDELDEALTTVRSLQATVLRHTEDSNGDV
jgi:hypothetical protein